MSIDARTWLFVPGSTPHRFDRATTSAAEAVVLDLEDAVHPSDKTSARESAASWLAGSGRAWVRINGSGTPWHDEDLAAIGELPGLQGIVVPKAEDPEAFAILAHRWGGGVMLVALVESAFGIQNAGALARASGVTRLAFGSLDFALDVRADHADGPLLYARGALVVASRAAGLPAPIDGVTTSTKDLELVARESRQSRAAGFGGKLCIHPAQLSAVADAFRASDEEREWAHEVLAAAGSSNDAVTIGPDGSMIDKPVVDRAYAILRD